ncbi:Apoptosis-inducing factor 3 [Perkinsus olseni]|uniref:Apoptosis-inducing factor 3 n=1 Tax=Perkinsus olseni TaxID=32597 RepID=A0A7J6PB81_PEROL|nr:Apoptosis-inducing factor 3 [Perkinsus olseni]
MLSHRFLPQCSRLLSAINTTGRHRTTPIQHVPKPGRSASGVALALSTLSVAAATVHNLARKDVYCDEKEHEFTKGGEWVKLGGNDEFENGEMYEMQVGENRKILITRTKDGRLYCTGALCSHYGFPLKKGIFLNDTVVCPLHDATFDIKTGEPLRGPGLDAIPTYKIEVREDGVYADLPKKSDLWIAKENVQGMAKRDPEDKRVYVIVGGGAAAATAAESLRQNGYTGRIIMMTRERHLPYDRPVLSKKLDAADDPSKLYLRDREFYAKHDIEVWTDTLVTKVDAEHRIVEIQPSESHNHPSEVTYDKCLWAAGSDARKAYIPGLNAKTPDDAHAITEYAEAGQRVVLVGSGFIGMEMASALVSMGVDVTVVGRETVPFQRVLGKKVGAYFAHMLAERHIQFIGGTTVKLLRSEAMEHGSYSEDSLVNGVELDDGDLLFADAVIMGTGAVPNTSQLTGVQRAADGSLPTDPFLGVQMADGSFSEPLRVEHWDVALQMGRIAGANMAGKFRPYTTVPYFWTMIFGKSLRYVGSTGGKDGSNFFDNVIIEGDFKESRFVAYYCRVVV